MCMNKENTIKIAQVKNHAEDLMMELYALSEIKNGDKLTATDELLMNRDLNATPKLFLEYTVADSEQQHITNAYRHVIEALKELGAAENVRTDMKRGIQ